MTMQRRAAEDRQVASDFWRGLASYYTRTSDDEDVRTRRTAEALLAATAPRDGALVLDAGCGHQRITRALERLRPDLRLFGADLTLELLRNGREIGARFPLAQADIAELPYATASFDAITSARVFQYIADPPRALRELSRVLKPGGRLAISLPNINNPIKRARYRGRLSGPRDIRRWLREAGLRDVQVGTICFVPRPLGRRWDSSWRHVDLLRHVPLVGQLGGNVIGWGRKGEADA